MIEEKAERSKKKNKKSLSGKSEITLYTVVAFT
jgi:hypothetical protein